MSAARLSSRIKHKRRDYFQETQLKLDLKVSKEWERSKISGFFISHEGFFVFVLVVQNIHSNTTGRHWRVKHMITRFSLHADSAN